MAALEYDRTLSISEIPVVTRNWTASEKFIFRLAFIFLLLLIIPLAPTWYNQFFHPRSFFWFLSSLTGYRPNFVHLHSESARFGLAGYSSWSIALGIGFVGAVVWTALAGKKNIANYNVMYYWLRVLVRYRIALGIIAFGFLKFYPMQMPSPAISNLQTNLGDYNTYKIYWQQVGVSIWYEIVLGIVEILGGVLLFFRGTTAFGAILTGGVLYNIAHANIAYDGAVHVYSSLFVLLSLFLLIPYVKNIWALLIRKKNVTPHYYYPVWDSSQKRFWSRFLKYAFIFLFTIVYGILRYDVHYRKGYLKDPITLGLPNAAGYYNVTSFKLNGNEIPYNPFDSVRWKNVVFEKWSTLTYQVYKAFPISLANGTPSKNDVDRSYELAGIAGGRRFLYYNSDTVKHELYLEDKGGRPNWEDGDAQQKKNTAIGGNKGKGKASHESKPDTPKLVWHFLRPSKDRIILYGLNEQKDSIYAVLDRVNIAYPIQTKRHNASL